MFEHGKVEKSGGSPELTRREVVQGGLAAGAVLAGIGALANPAGAGAQATPVATPEPGSTTADAEHWPAYARDPGGLRYSPLTQIDPGNVDRLELAWTFRTGELERFADGSFPTVAFEATPIMLDGTLYFSTSSARVFAIDAATGRERWVHETALDFAPAYANPVSRGVSAWTDASLAPGDAGYRTIFVGTVDGRLVALDAATGSVRTGFGTDGIVDLRAGAAPIGGGSVEPGMYQVTSPPAVVGDLVVVGAAISDNVRVSESLGIVRAFDVRSGAERWRWDPIPREPGQPGYGTWSGARAHESGAANAWAPISADAERGLVFVPTSSPSPDYYGGERIGENLYADCVVCLQASTGAMVWAFQTVHHDLWDYDVPMQPVLLDLRRGNEDIPAVAVGAKTGHIFVLHRETGTPLFPVEERPVPASNVPGEEAWPTQPFPVDLPVFGLRDLSADDAWGLSPDALEAAREAIGGVYTDGLFTPVDLQPTAQAPSNFGGFNWGGLSYDPERRVLVGATNRVAAFSRLYPREETPAGDAPPGLERAEQRETPYTMERGFLVDVDTGLPYTRPPWGTLAGVNLRTPGLQFETPFGAYPDLDDHPEAEEWGSLSLGGPITTASGIVFIGAAQDDVLRAFDTETGTLLWKGSLPAGGQATPMTYMVDGRQFVVIAAGGNAALGTTLGDYVVAFALPQV